jgi:CDGSH-type Zn-finger protein
VKLTLISNGPIILDTQGEVQVQIGDKTETKTGPLYLCRCGQSANKPFCDGAHRKLKFEGTGAELVCR